LPCFEQELLALVHFMCEHIFLTVQFFWKLSSTSF
jgi:hypothetical protein